MIYYKMTKLCIKTHCPFRKIHYVSRYEGYDGYNRRPYGFPKHHPILRKIQHEWKQNNAIRVVYKNRNITQFNGQVSSNWSDYSDQKYTSKKTSNKNKHNAELKRINTKSFQLGNKHSNDHNHDHVPWLMIILIITSPLPWVL